MDTENLLNTSAPTTEPAAVEPAAVEPAAVEPVKEAPEKYEFKAPEGAILDEQLIGSFSEAAKELKLSQDAAQQLLDKMAPAIEKRNAEVFDTMRETWKQQTIVDKFIGGAELDKNLAVAKRGLEFAGSKELRKLLDDSGLGNHPEVIRAFHKVGAMIGEDGKFISGAAPSQQKTLAERLYTKKG
jgi:hypothetical protein